MTTDTAPAGSPAPGYGSAAPMLELSDVHVYYGNIAAVQGLSAVTVLGNGRPVFILDVPRLVAA